MVGLPAGQFLMGSPDSDRDAESWEKPQHQVKINSFAIGKYPVTQAQYQAVMGTNPSYFKNNPQNPVENVSWDDAQAFCQKLSQITGKTYRLPTEAEWEYACRAGTTTDYYFGDYFDDCLKDYAWYYGNSQDKTHPVGQKKPNGWGLYDMSGNVWEWCADTWHDNYDSAPTDGSAWIENGNDNLPPLRGGSWLNFPNGCRSAYRCWVSPDYLNDFDLGFRVACDNQMFFYNAFNFPFLTSSVKEFAVKLENMLVKLEHRLAISEDGLYCKIYQPSTNAYPGVYNTQKVYEMLNNFNKHKNYLWSFLQDCKA